MHQGNATGSTFPAPGNSIITSGNIVPTYPNTIGYNQPIYSNIIVTTTDKLTDSMNENVVNIERVDNGYIVTLDDKTLVAKDLFELMILLTEKFEKKEEK